MGPCNIGAARARLKSYEQPAYSAPFDAVSSRSVRSNELNVLVTEDGRHMVSIAMPSRAAYNLIGVIPPDVIDYINSTDSVDLDEVIKRVEDTEAAPQTLFELDKGNRHYRVWLV